MERRYLEAGINYEDDWDNELDGNLIEEDEIDDDILEEQNERNY